MICFCATRERRSDDFGLSRPIIQKPFRPKQKRYRKYLHRSTRLLTGGNNELATWLVCLLVSTAVVACVTHGRPGVVAKAGAGNNCDYSRLIEERTCRLNDAGRCWCSRTALAAAADKNLRTAAVDSVESPERKLNNNLRR